MSAPSVRPAIDTAPRPGIARHTLALVLGLLALPGSTIAWDLPVGGLWIGVPLSVAALRVGMLARSETTDSGRRRTALIGMLIGGACLLFTAAAFAFGAPN